MMVQVGISRADWSSPHAHDVLKPLRDLLLSTTSRMQGPARLIQRHAEPSKSPLFSEAEVASVRSQLFASLGISQPPEAWVVRDHQPICLNALHALASFCGDPDTSLFTALKEGVPTGYFEQHPVIKLFLAKSQRVCG